MGMALPGELSCPCDWSCYSLLEMSPNTIHVLLNGMHIPNLVAITHIKYQTLPCPKAQPYFIATEILTSANEEQEQR